MHTTGLKAAVRGHGDHHGEGSGRGDLHYHELALLPEESESTKPCVPHVYHHDSIPQ